MPPARCRDAAGSSTAWHHRPLRRLRWQVRGRDGRMPRFEWPWALLLLLAIPWTMRWARRTRRRPTPAFGFNRVCAAVPRSRRERWLRLPAILRIVAIVLLILALAGPRLSGRR